MSMSKKKLLSKVSALNNSLDELEEKLELILSKPLDDTIGGLETLQQTKLLVLLPYIINDLIFIYLRTKGIDPKTHPVITELERVRQYFEKIKNAEEQGKTRTTVVDKAVAARFIKHAISQARNSVKTDPASASSLPTPTPTPKERNEAGPSTLVPAKITEKMKERDRYLEQIAQDSDSSEPMLDIIDDDSGAVPEPKSSEVSGSGEAQAQSSSSALDSERFKKKRPRPMDPFGSFGEETPEASTSTPTPTSSSTKEVKSKKQKKKDKKLESIADDPTAAIPSRVSRVPSFVMKKRKAKRGGK